MTEAERNTALLQADRVSKEVSSPGGPLTIVDDVSLSLVAGESLAIVGASGSGKSTLLGLLAGLDLPTRGRIQLAGEEITALDEDGRALLRACHVGFVFQAFHLIPGLTARENVMLPLELAGRDDATDKADHALARVGLSARAAHYPRQLSGGEQQRVAIARAFATGPRLLLADEPTGNLDSQTGEEIMGLFEELYDNGQTILLVTHEHDIAQHARRTIMLRDGLIESDTAARAVVGA